jgi:hypothetical protein
MQTWPHTWETPVQFPSMQDRERQISEVQICMTLTSDKSKVMENLDVTFVL